METTRVEIPGIGHVNITRGPVTDRSIAIHQINLIYAQLMVALDAETPQGQLEADQYTLLMVDAITKLQPREGELN